MHCSSFNTLRCKEVVNIRDGCRLGYVEDVVFDVESGTVCELKIPGRRRFLGLLPPYDTITIPWCAIERIGDDIIIIAWDIIKNEHDRVTLFDSIAKWFNQ